MGFFDSEQKVGNPAELAGVSLDFFHRHQCRVCPLNHLPGLRHPQMGPTGSNHPIVYVLGSATAKKEDELGKHFVGNAGQVLRMRIPDEWLKDIRWNNCVRTRTPDGRAPTEVEIECCRSSVVKDIEQSKPRAIFGFGNVPLRWALDEPGITNWRGRRIPVQIGTHKCWFFPMLHPKDVMQQRKFEPRPGQYGSDDELAFAKDIEFALASIDTLPAPIIHTTDDVFANLEWVTGSNGRADLDRVREVLDQMAQCNVIGFDYETNAKRPYSKKSKLLSVALASKDLAFAFPFAHRQAGWSEDELAELMGRFEQFLLTAKCRKAVHALAFEMEWSAEFFGADVLRAQNWEDTLSEAYVLDEGRGKEDKDGESGWGKGHALDFLCLLYFGVHIKKLSDVNRKDLDAEPLDKMLKYNCIDAKYHRYLHLVQIKRLKDEDLLDVYDSALRRVPTVVLTQRKGIPVNQEVVKGFYKEFTKARDAAAAEILDTPEARKYQARFGKPFRPSAPADVRKMVHKILGIPIDNVDEKALEKVKHPFVQKELRWRKANKALSTYVEPYRVGAEKSQVHEDGRLHPIFSTTRTRTWRTSSDSPNAQNAVKRSENKKIRKQVEARPGYKMVAFDYAGIQARNVAMESRDKVLTKAFIDWYDVHTDWMERAIELYPRWIKEGLKAFRADKKLIKAYRNVAKNGFVFPSFFGAGAGKVAGVMGIPEAIAAKMREEFFDRFNGVHKWHARLETSFQELGYVTGHSGFRRRAPAAYNERINAPIQADESVIVIGAMNRLSEMEELRYQANIEIHDDLTFEWADKEIDRNAEVVIREMVKIEFDWIRPIPLVVEMSIGQNWCDLDKPRVFESVGDYDYREVVE